MEQLTKNQAVATSQEAVQNQNEPQLRDENAHNDKSVHGVLNPTYQAGLRRRSEERFSRNAETDLVCRLLLEKKKVPYHRAQLFRIESLGERRADYQVRVQHCKLAAIGS